MSHKTLFLLCAGLAPVFSIWASPPDGWQHASARAEIEPDFMFDSVGGLHHQGTLITNADGREGLDGHWFKSFKVEGGKYYKFHALRRLENVPPPASRCALIRILWRDEKGQPVSRDETGATSYAPGSIPAAEPEYPY